MHDFTLTDGTLSVELNDGSNVWTTSYSLATPDSGAADCVDQLELLFLTTPDTTTMRKIERLLERAAARQKTRRGPKIYIEVEMDADTETWRAEVFQGGFAADSLINDTYIGKTRATLIVQRAPFWEGEEAEIALRNSATMADPGPAAGGVEIANNPATGCWVHIDDDQVLGALPAPVRLRIKNTSGGDRDYRIFVAGVNAFSTPIASVTFIQAEAELGGLGTDSAFGTMSGGSSWESDAFSTATLLGTWNFGTGLTASSEGRWWRLLARLIYYNPADEPVFWPVIYDYWGFVKLWTGPEVRPKSGGVVQLLDLGPIPLPPGPYDVDYAPCKLGLFGSASASTTVGIDYFYVMPMDSLRIVEQIGMFVADDDCVEFDEIEGRYYMVESVGRSALHVPSEAPLVVFPGVAQRLHILYRGDTSMAIDKLATIQLWYRPRRLTL